MLPNRAWQRARIGQLCTFTLAQAALLICRLAPPCPAAARALPPLQGLTLRPTEHVPEKAGVVPPGATLEYELSLVRVSIPPS